MIVSIANQKGGVGKSTTAQSLGAGLASKGYKVLLIDMDSQGNLTYSCGAGKGSASTLEVLKREATAQEAIQTLEHYDIIPATISLAGADMQLTEMGKEYRLKEALKPLEGRYDYIILDCPPALGILTINALTASDCVVIPAQADVYSLDAVCQLSSTIDAVRQYTNKNLMVAGILLTRYSDRAILSRDLSDMISQTAERLGTKLFKATIREAVAIKEAQASQKDILTYNGRSNVANDYIAFTEEFLETFK